MPQSHKKKMQFTDLKAKIELSQLHKLTFSTEWKLNKNECKKSQRIAQKCGIEKSKMHLIIAELTSNEFGFITLFA